MRRTDPHTVSLATTAAGAASNGEFRVTERASGSSAPVKPCGRFARPAGLAFTRDSAATLPAAGRLALRSTGPAPLCIDESTPDPTLVTDLDVPFPKGGRPRARRRAHDPLAVG
jgi:hypothetical protein